MMPKKLLPPTYLFLSIVIMVGLHFLFPAAKIIPFPWNLLGAVPFAFGLALNLLADRAFKKHDTTVKPFQESAALVTAGVFRVSRNPMYLGFVLILVGIAIFMGSLTPWAIIPILAIWMDLIFIKVEERMLERTFGDRWLEYKKSVRRWI
jgi:protein-S-isoprenylcysteine O-methyltransferase Ste14